MNQNWLNYSSWLEFNSTPHLTSFRVAFVLF